MLRPALVLVLAAFAASAANAETALDYDFFKRKVEPIFLKKRADHVRCSVCHQLSNNAFLLEKLPERASSNTASVDGKTANSCERPAT